MEILYAKVAGQGTPLVILHGYLGMSDNWKTLASKYVGANFQVHLLDLRNHGRSFHDTDFNYQVMMEDVVAYCRENQLTKIDLIGHSMGGKVAMKLACHYPELIDRLIIADISPRQYKPHHQQIMEALNAVDFNVQTSRDAIENVIRTYVKEEGVVQFLMKNVYRKTPEQLAFRFNLSAFNEDDAAIGEALEVDERFDGATLFLRGEQSNYIQAADEILIHQHFQKASIATVSNAGHWLHADNPELFFQLTTDFLTI